MEFASNRYRLPVRDLPDPAEWSNEQAKMLWEMIRDGSPIIDLSIRPRFVEVRPNDFCYPIDMDDDLVVEAFDEYLFSLQTWIERQRKMMERCGPPKSVVQPLDIDFAGHAIEGDDRQTYICRLMKKLKDAKWRICSAGGSPVTIDFSGNYIRAHDQVPAGGQP